MSSMQRVFYGGQAVMEGVLMRGQFLGCVAVRRPDGVIVTRSRPVGLWASSPLRRIPLIRGVLVLAESLTLGMWALQWSANVALEEEGQELTGRQMAVTIAIAFGVAAIIFFAMPALATGWLERYLPTPIVVLLEGIIRIGFLLAYLWFIGRMAEVRRLFAYHGAEHKTIHAYEAGVPLDVPHIQKFSPAHPRCGTSFLLVVMVASVFVFALLGNPPLEWRLLSRVLLVPVIAAVAYEVLRFGAKSTGRWWSVFVVSPGLALQKLTTREPEDDQVVVALTAFNTLREEESIAGSPPGRSDLEAEINA